MLGLKLNHVNKRVPGDYLFSLRAWRWWRAKLSVPRKSTRHRGPLTPSGGFSYKRDTRWRWKYLQACRHDGEWDCADRTETSLEWICLRHRGRAIPAKYKGYVMKPGVCFERLSLYWKGPRIIVTYPVSRRSSHLWSYCTYNVIYTKFKFGIS